MLVQKCAGWFLLKMLGSGTMASKIFSKSGSENEPYFHGLLLKIFEKCMKSWFKRHKSNNAMKIGALNEDPTVAKLRNECCYADDVTSTSSDYNSQHRATETNIIQYIRTYQYIIILYAYNQYIIMRTNSFTRS